MCQEGRCMKKEGLIAPLSLFNFIKEPASEPVRVDIYLTMQFPLYSRSFFKKLIEEAFVSINGKKVQKQSTLAQPGDAITVQFPAERTMMPEHIEASKLPVTCIATHEHFFIISKPVGLLVHPPHTHSTMVTLMDWLAYTFKELESVGYVDRPGIVHRLDKNTSGIMIVPRTQVAHFFFSQSFEKHTMHKVYHAVVQGRPPAEGTIDFPVGRHPEIRVKMHAFAPHEQPPRPTRFAVTHYKVLEYFADTALVELCPVTGRTHQLRIHCAAIGHSIVGDVVYGQVSSDIDRQALHAYQLSFTFFGTEHQFTAPYPEDFAKLIAGERGKMAC